jgi:hypothetical protein
MYYLHDDICLAPRSLWVAAKRFWMLHEWQKIHKNREMSSSHRLSQVLMPQQVTAKEKFF